MNKIIGRSKEVKLLDVIWYSKEPEFVALYGRRRVGKTYLVRRYFGEKKCIYFELTGAKDAKLSEQLENFAEVFSKIFLRNITIKSPENWRQALKLLSDELDVIKPTQKIVLFFDELPWLASKRSMFIQALDYYWNTRWSRLNNIKVIVCGSAASWMLEKLIHAKGGLHNRLTRTINLKPFNLATTKVFLEHKGIKYSAKQIVDVFMIMGGIPYYLNQLNKHRSIVQNIDDVCFSNDGLLYDEFDKLFKSLFDFSEISQRIVREIARSHYGVSRNNLLKKLAMKSGGTFNKRIKELVAAGFVQSIVPYGKKAKEVYFRVIDEYCIFYLRWIEPYINENITGIKNYWHSIVNKPAWHSWAGYSFESVCYKHVHQIQSAIGLDNITYKVGSWRYLSSKGEQLRGAQIDLLFDRDDGVITIAEIKYTVNQFVIDKAYGQELLNKMEAFKKYTQANKQIQLAMITLSGVKSNLWSHELVSVEVNVEDFL